MCCLEGAEGQGEGGVEATAASCLADKDVSIISCNHISISVCPGHRGREVRVHVAGQSVISSSNQGIGLTQNGDDVLKSCRYREGIKVIKVMVVGGRGGRGD